MTTTPTERPAGSIDPKLLEILVCPLTKSTLEYDAEKQELEYQTAARQFSVSVERVEARQAGDLEAAAGLLLRDLPLLRLLQHHQTVPVPLRHRENSCVFHLPACPSQ